MKVLYVDAFAGISGDMSVGALLSLGVSLETVQRALDPLPLTGYTIAAEPRKVQGIAATQFVVHTASHAHSHRAFRDIRQMLEGSSVAPSILQRALAIFTALAAAEGRVHGVAPDDVTFHEVGAVDSIVDIVGAAAGLDALNIERLYVSPLPLGAGIVQSQHGPIPVPAPATVELLRGFTTRPGDGTSELVTPTGAAILAALATPEPPPELRLLGVGYGSGQRTLKDRPNLLRLVLAEPVVSVRHEQLTLIETNIDDCNPEFYEYVMDRLFAAGALDVYLAPVHMKKNRPGVVLSVLCADSARDKLSQIMLSETSAIGLRHHPVERLALTRETRSVTTPYGTVQVKVAFGPDGHENLAPEYDDCKRLAQERQVPLKHVYQAALLAASTGHK